ncbi:MAG: GNAT family N-acetyltransferase [Actinomycetales bacterium]|uniref:GNAT family N-acetyltransferase n=1 Tax=uncultured Salinibacterium sp. TaxID=459274 RepID=UPI0030D97162
MSIDSVIAKSWGELTTTELYSIMKLRTDVFFVEQKVDETELDDRDQEAATRHYWIADNHGVAAYVRVLHNETAEYLDGHCVIGRVVVREDRRGEGLAQIIMKRIVDDYSDQAMMLHAQQYIVPLYTKFGFEAFGDLYEEATIMHQSMYRPAQ